jgi:hypothetical protein
MIAAFGFSLLGMVLWQATAPPDIAGKWTGDEWGEVVLEGKQPGQYQGSYVDSGNARSGTVRLKWSRAERRFNGTWEKEDNRSGKISIRLVGDEIRGAWTTDTNSEKEPGTLRLADLLWTRTEDNNESRSVQDPVTAQTQPAEPEGKETNAAEKPVAKGMEFLAHIPELRELNLGMTEARLREIIHRHRHSVVATCTDESGRKHYRLYTTAGEHVRVGFREGKCGGIQRLRPDRDMATRLYASYNESLNAYFEACQFHCNGQGDRVEAAQRFAEAARSSVQLGIVSEIGDWAQELADLLEKMAKEPRPEGQKSPADVFDPSGDISLTEELEHLFFDVRDLSYVPVYVPAGVPVRCRVLGEVGCLNKGLQNPAVRIRDLAKDPATRELVIRRLLRMLDDRRPTRSWAGATSGHVLRYCDVALEILDDVAGRETPNRQVNYFDPRTTPDAYVGTANAKTHKEIVSRVRVWWAKEQAEEK